MWSLQLPGSWGEAYSRFCEVGIGRTFQTPSNAGIPLHAHSNEEEVFYVVRGKLRFPVAEATEEHGPGGLVRAAKNVPHLFVNTGDEEAGVIVIARPGGIDRFFAEVGTEIGAADAPAPPTQEEIGRILALAPAYGITVFPPAG